MNLLGSFDMFVAICDDASSQIATNISKEPNKFIFGII